MRSSKKYWKNCIHENDLLLCKYLHLPDKDLNKQTYFCENNSGVVDSRFFVWSHEIVILLIDFVLLDEYPL